MMQDLEPLASRIADNLRLSSLFAPTTKERIVELERRVAELERLAGVRPEPPRDKRRGKVGWRGG